MDRILLRYTEYNEPHESRTNEDIVKVLKIFILLIILLYCILIIYRYKILVYLLCIHLNEIYN